MTSPTSSHEGNLLLESLPPRVQRRLLRQAEPETLQTNEVLYELGQPIEYVHFPTKGCVTSAIKVLADSKSFDAWLVGYDGLVGMEAFLGLEEAQFGAKVRVGGAALRMNAESLRSETRDGGMFSEVLQRYAQYLLLVSTQKAGCNRFHSVQRHFSSWLLLIHDRIVGDEVELTHEVFARMLGVRRVGISQAAQKLQEAGLLRYSWGKLTVVDRTGLEENACACYQQTTQAYRRLLDTAWPYR